MVSTHDQLNNTEPHWYFKKEINFAIDGGSSVPVCLNCGVAHGDALGRRGDRLGCLQICDHAGLVQLNPSSAFPTGLQDGQLIICVSFPVPSPLLLYLNPPSHFPI